MGKNLNSLKWKMEKWKINIDRNIRNQKSDYQKYLYGKDNRLGLIIYHRFSDKILVQLK